MSAATNKRKERKVRERNGAFEFINGRPALLKDGFPYFMATYHQMEKEIEAYCAKLEMQQSCKHLPIDKCNVAIRQKHYADLAVEQRVLPGLNNLIHSVRRLYMPPDMMWEIWGYIPASVKQTFRDLRLIRLTSIYIKSISKNDCVYETSLLNSLIVEIPFDKLLKFIEFGSPAKYYKQEWRDQPTLLEYVKYEASNNVHIQSYAALHIISMIVYNYKDGKIDEMAALINSVLYVHRRFGKANVIQRPSFFDSFGQPYF